MFTVLRVVQYRHALPSSAKFSYVMRSEAMKLIKISDLVLEEKFYPRMKADWLTAHQYAEAMRAGAKFPPIDVCNWKGKWIVVDGWHRVQAHKNIKEDYIQANILDIKNAKDIYLEAVKRNSHHGRQFSVQERVNICLRRLPSGGFAAVRAPQFKRKV